MKEKCGREQCYKKVRERVKNPGRDCKYPMCFPVFNAGFFAKSQIMFFLLSSFRLCPSLKNDGRSELRFFKGIKYLPVILERSEESGQRLQDLNILICVHQLAPITSQARHFSPSSGEADAKEKRNYSFYDLNTRFPISYAGFFAKSQIMFFLLSSFRLCPPLKNDGRSELHFPTV